MKYTKLHVIKVGGNVINDATMLLPLLEAFSMLSGYKILVHGGGSKASEVAQRMSVPVEMVEGRRITNDQMIEVVTMVYGGLINKQMVTQLQAMGCDALGLTGADANLILSQKRPVKSGIDYGWVGDPIQIDVKKLRLLLDIGLVPVLAPLTHDGRGHILNTNADTIANMIAVSMSSSFEVHLLYAFELPGVMRELSDPNSLIKVLDRTYYQKLKSKGIVSQGMIPKLDNAFQAIAHGVRRVCITKFDNIHLLASNDEYTTIS